MYLPAFNVSIHNKSFVDLFDLYEESIYLTIWPIGQIKINWLNVLCPELSLQK